MASHPAAVVPRSGSSPWRSSATADLTALPEAVRGRPCSQQPCDAARTRAWQPEIRARPTSLESLLLAVEVKSHQLKALLVAPCLAYTGTYVNDLFGSLDRGPRHGPCKCCGASRPTRFVDAVERRYLPVCLARSDSSSVDVPFQTDANRAAEWLPLRGFSSPGRPVEGRLPHG